ncbi:MAG: aspartate 1-decarboxylase [Proteobacteria bacterium]|nr:aspartate 1-decarboxylase [Pseudomonadota bacterium]
MRKILKSKIHRAVITDANLEYEGSITLPQYLIDAADLVEYEAVHVWDVTNGSRFETYVIKGAVNSSDIIINGAAAHLVSIGDTIIVASFTWLAEQLARIYQPVVIHVDSQNKII